MPLGISLASTIVQAGSKLEGSVFFEINKECSAKELIAVLEGYEKTRVEYEEGTGDDRRTRTADSRRRLVQMSIPLNHQSMIDPIHHKVQPGKYLTNFQIDLPDGLPSSMEGSGRSFADRCSIYYEIRAQLKGSGWVSDYKASESVTIVAKPLQKEAAPYRGEPVRESVRTCCCWNRGYIVFGARVDDTMLDKGEAVRVSMSCRNHTGVKVTALQATLVETLQWSAQSKREHRTRTLATVQFPRFSDLVEATPSAVDNLSNHQQDLQNIQRELENATHSGTIVMPTDAHDTFEGKLISCRHSIRVIVETGCCVDNPEIDIPIQAGPVAIHGQPSQSPAQVPPDGFANGASVSNPILMTSSTPTVLGGSPYDTSGGDEDEQDLLIPPFDPPPPSMARLLKELDESISDYDLIAERVNDRDWNTIFEGMSPAEYGKIIKMVDLDFDQPKMAECMAPAIGSKFTCDYCVAAVRSASDFNRSSIVEKVLPFIVDLSTNKGKILSELSDWEKTVTERAFANAMK